MSAKIRSQYDEFFSLYAFTQHIDYKSLSVQQLQSVLQKELQDMEAKGTAPHLIMEKFVVDGNEYLQSRESYFRFLVHTEYIVDELLEMKMENGTDKANDFEMAEKFRKPKIQKSYQEY